MKRSGPIARRTPLARTRTPSERQVPVGVGVKPRKQVRAIPFPPEVAALLDARDEWCQRCGSPRDLERHHRRGKADGGSENRPHTHCACNGVRLCLTCHIWAHRHGRLEAEAQGFVVGQSVSEPGQVSVMRGSEDGGGASMWATCEGQWVAESPWTEAVA